jgi:hypothetical protein
MKTQHTQLWNLLQSNGIVEGAQPKGGDIDSPWFVKVLLAFSGWLAALFILGFLGVAFEYVVRNSMAAATVGIVFLFGAYTLLRHSTNAFLEHLGLATSMAGQALIAYAIFDLTGDHDLATWPLLCAVQVILIAVMASFVHRTFSTLAATLTLAMAFHQLHLPPVTCGLTMLGAGYCWLNEFRHPLQMKKMRAIGYGLVLALIVLKGSALFGYTPFAEPLPRDNAPWTQPWFEEILVGVVTVSLTWKVVRRYGQPSCGRLAVTTALASALICAVSTSVHGVTVGMAIVCLGFIGSNRVLLGLGITSLLFFISSYYYLLDETLLEKSRSLLVAGITLLIVRWLMLRLTSTWIEGTHE